MHRLERRQTVGAELDAVFRFFKDPTNLEELTPRWLGFRVLDSTDAEVRVGTVIRYRLRLHGVPIGWTSRISELEEGVMFADEMLSGPYRRWYHRHRFRPVSGGTEIVDIVEYALPLGPIGRLVHTLSVKRQLRAIFDFRAARATEIFGSWGFGPDPH